MIELGSGELTCKQIVRVAREAHILVRHRRSGGTTAGAARTGAVGDVWAACAALPAEMTDRDLTDDVRLAEGLLDVIAPFGADSGHDGSRTPDHPLQLEDGTL